ncbi:unnamed protein product [Eruca vesicaria subsp. sativa]|uniref:Uncharacterized protein n=1 Tax=Eruca vesicaria subsp. sativa TaxID=29727 RepID=A0ABC8LK74_ERUVS|nr:unnamed protein product [Eruca vesicaria subsp. sativa]
MHALVYLKLFSILVSLLSYGVLHTTLSALISHRYHDFDITSFLTKALKLRKSSRNVQASSSKAQKPRKSSTKALKLRKSSRNVSSTCKQRRISNYFPPIGLAGNLNDEVSVPMDEDNSLSNYHIVSQYGAQQYGSTSSTSPPKAPLVQGPLLPPPHHPNQSTLPSLCTRSVIYDVSDCPNIPPLHHWMYQGLDIFDALSPDPPSLSQPKYDSSHNQALRRLPFTPDTSPDKSGDSLTGFLGHARTTNAFSATATSNPLTGSKFDEEQSEDIDIVELSEGSPGRPRPMHQPTCDENQLAKHLMRCKSIQVVDVINTLPQIDWDLFERFISHKKYV